jgi:putative component of membrane protein insertase Oxa1/YidC/SpoIIIJ protein YidD
VGRVWPRHSGGGRPLNAIVRRHMNGATVKAIQAIEWYQRVISPQKGFSCAYRVAWGGHSCSGAVKSAFAGGGLIVGVGALFEQPFRCYAAARMLSEQGPSQAPSEKDPSTEKPNFCAQYAAMEGAWWCCFLPFVGT